MGASSDLGQPFHPRYKIMVVFGLGKEQVISLRSTTTQYNCDNKSTKIWAIYWICNVSLERINSKYKYMSIGIFKVDYSAKFEWIFLKQ